MRQSEGRASLEGQTSLGDLRSGIGEVKSAYREPRLVVVRGRLQRDRTCCLLVAIKVDRIDKLSL